MDSKIRVDVIPERDCPDNEMYVLCSPKIFKTYFAKKENVIFFKKWYNVIDEHILTSIRDVLSGAQWHGEPKQQELPNIQPDKQE